MATTMTTQPARIQSTITSSDGNPRLNPTSSSSSDSASLSVSAKALCAKLRPPSMRLGWTRTVVNHVKKHMGVGIVCAVAYFDPGNWGVDLQAGSQFGYKLLFVVLLAGGLAVYLQVLASRLGCVTGLDLASHCRLLLHSRPKHTLLYRRLLLYPLYLLSETAIIATDLAELLGSAMAICMVFPACPMWVGVVATGLDVLFLLALGNPLSGKPVRAFEFMIAGLVFAVLICICIVISRIDVAWGPVFLGYIPSSAIVSKPDGIYVSTAILGATVMPHSLFLGSALATQDRESSGNDDDEKLLQLALQGGRRPRHDWAWFKSLFKAQKAPGMAKGAKSHKDWETNSQDFVKRHLYHGIVDVMSSLLGFAVLINSMILILASAVFFYGNEETQQANAMSPATLFDAYDLIRRFVGNAAGYLFAFALLAAGQSSSIIATVAGQAVSEGFLNWRVSPVMRRLITRLLSLVPSLIVAIAVGRSGVNNLLVASQVVLSIVLPFMVFPLVWLTSNREIMGVRQGASARQQTGHPIRGGSHTQPLSTNTNDDELDLPVNASTPSQPHPSQSSTSESGDGDGDGDDLVPRLSGSADSCTLASPISPTTTTASSSTTATATATPPSSSQPPPATAPTTAAGPDPESAQLPKVDYSNGWFTMLFGYAVWVLVVVANVYVMVQLAVGGEAAH